jgi:hypothetical protein
MSAFEKPSEPATVQSSELESAEQTTDASDTVIKPASSVATTREVEEWR